MTSRKVLLVPWLPAPVWKNFPMTKGLGHHRTPVGIILAANQKLNCVIENSSLDQVRVRLLNDDRKAEGDFKIKSSQPGRAGTISISTVSVPFLDCDYLNTPPKDDRKISISYPSGSKILPIYRFGDNEDKFFKQWDAQDAEFAYIESDYFGLLIPKIDKEAARKLAGGKHLNDIIVFYDKILTIYSQLLGLSFEESGTNQNVRNRFFLKADKNGWGMAYYGDWCTAVTSKSIKSFWLDLTHTNWGALHEIGHGHELKSLNDDTLSVGEVWNNVLAFFYQAIIFGKDLPTKGSKRSAMNIVGVLKSGKNVSSWGLFPKLSFLIHMFYKAGQKSFIRFNQLTRQEMSGRPYYASGATFVEKLMHLFALDFDIDVYPFMKLAKAVITEDQLFEHYYVLSNVAYPLNYLISDSKTLNSVKSSLGLLFETSLVTSSDLSSTKLKNDFTVKIDKDLSDLSGSIVKLMDGAETVAEEKITGQNIIFKDIPIGVYKVFVEPSLLNVKYIYSDFYALVHATNPSELVLTGKTMKEPSLLADKIKFLGLGDSQFAILSSNPFKKSVSFRFFSSKPHSYFSNKKYASIVIKNQANEVIFSETINGDTRASGMHTMKMEGQLEIEIFHAETKNRLKLDDPMLNVIIDRKSQTHTLLLSERGFENKKMKTPQELLEKNYLKKIEYKANKIRNKISLYVRPQCQPKYNLLLAVEAFERLFKNNTISTSLRDQYKDCLPASTNSESKGKSQDKIDKEYLQ